MYVVDRICKNCFFRLHITILKDFCDHAMKDLAKLSLLDFAPAEAAVGRLRTAARKAQALQMAATGDLPKLNLALRQTETASGRIYGVFGGCDSRRERGDRQPQR